MSLDLTRLKRIEQDYKHLVFGYIRRYEQKLLILHNQNAFYHIPELITISCLLYYCNEEIFGDVSRFLHQSEDDRNTITCNNEMSAWRCAFGKEWYESESEQLIAWNVKFVEAQSVYRMAVGIISNKHDQNTEQDFDTNHSYYFCPCGVLRIDGESASTKSSFALNLMSGDTLTFMLDLSNRVISCYKNALQANTFIVCDNVKVAKDIRYRFALSMIRTGNKVNVTPKMLAK